MPKFRKKPMVIEAVQWFDGKTEHSGVARYPDNTPYVTTVHGHTTPIADGDWIIPGPRGKGFYPCKPDIFEATYEAVEPQNGE